MGCASLKQKVQPQEDQVAQNEDSLPHGFIKSIKEHNQNIVDSSKISMDQQSNLMNSFQFFQFNSRHLWQIAISPEYLKSNIDLILESIEGLLNVLPTYIKSNMTYTLFISKILAAYAKIVFQFFATNGKRFLELDTQIRYLNLITNIESELQIERDNDQLLNNVEFELFQIKAAFTLAPTNSKEGQEILTQFLGGALKAAMTFTLNDDLIESLKKGIIYIYNEYKKHQIKRKFEIIYYITGLKYEIIQDIEKNSDRNKVYDILTKFYLKIIKDCIDWEIQCSWIQSISEIINHKILLNSQVFQEKLFQDCLQKRFIIKIKEECYANINNSHISDDVDANKIFQQVEQLKLLSNIQRELIQGNQKLQGFEDFYKIKMKLQRTDSSLLIDKSTLNNIKFHIKNQTIQQKKITDEIKKKENNNYLDALINEQLEQISLLDQDLHQLTQHKALLSTMISEQDDSQDSADHQIAMTHYLIDILRTNNQELKDESLYHQLSKFDIPKENQLSQKDNINIILKLEQQLKFITGRRIKIQTTFKLYSIFFKLSINIKIQQFTILSFYQRSKYRLIKQKGQNIVTIAAWRQQLISYIKLCNKYNQIRSSKLRFFSSLLKFKNNLKSN